MYLGENWSMHWVYGWESHVKIVEKCHLPGLAHPLTSVKICLDFPDFLLWSVTESLPHSKVTSFDAFDTCLDPFFKTPFCDDLFFKTSPVFSAKDPAASANWCWGATMTAAPIRNSIKAWPILNLRLAASLHFITDASIILWHLNLKSKTLNLGKVLTLYSSLANLNI